LPMDKGGGRRSKWHAMCREVSGRQIDQIE